MGSRENLKSPQTPTDCQTVNEWSPSSRKNSLAAESITYRRTSVQEPVEPHHQSTSDMFKDLLSQKRNMILSKLTSFDSEVMKMNINTIIYFLEIKIKLQSL